MLSDSKLSLLPVPALLQYHHRYYMSLSCSFQLTWVWKRDTVSSGKTGSLFVTSGVYMYMLQLDWGKEHSTSVWDTALPGYWLPIYLNVAYLNVGCSFFYISPFLFSNNFYFLFPSDFWSHGCVKASGPCMCLFLYRMCCSALLHMAPSWSALLGLQWVFCVWRTLVFLALLLTCSIIRLHSWSHMFCWHSVCVLH